MNNGYIIPANSKKSMLILGLFTGVDLIIFSVGCIITLCLLFIVKNADVGQMILIISPALISAFLVAPVSNYHNILQLLTNIITFLINRKSYYWRGWCVRDVEEK